MTKPTKLAIVNGKRVRVPIDYRNRTDSDKAYNQKRNRENKEYVSFYITTWQVLQHALHTYIPILIDTHT